jgi:polyphosphate kinase 2 (PPK2 family)
LEDPEKQWKFSAADLAERAFWKQYMQAYEETLAATSTDHAPWYVIPADHKWVTRAIVADITTTTLRNLKLKYPALSAEQRAELSRAHKQLRREKGAK